MRPNVIQSNDLDDYIYKVVELGRLQDNWDTHQARGVSLDARDRAIALLRAVRPNINAQKLFICPTVRGEILVDWLDKNFSMTCKPDDIEVDEGEG